MQEVEKKRQEELDSKMNVTIDLQKGTTTLKVDEEDKMFTFGAQNKQVNEFLGKTFDKSSGGVKKFKPFEIEQLTSQITDEDDPRKQLEKLNSFTFKACTNFATDEKSKKL